jgi:peroxiredoxin
MNPEMKFGIEEMENGFKKSADTILQKFKGNKETKDFALHYLTLGFKEIGQEKVLQYIDEKYSTDLNQCTNDADKIAFDERKAGYAKMKVGMQAPEIEFNDAQGTLKTLKDIRSDRVIVAFWASWCPHCSQEMPKLNSLIETKKGAKVLAISLDEDWNSYDQAILKLRNMIHYSDFKKWNEKSVIDYHIVATPSFIVLDKERKILGKYSSIEEMEKSGFL